MASPTSRRLAPALLVGSLAVWAGPAAAQDAAHRHMGHVADQWNDTPDQMGLLPAAQAEAEVANQHAALATAQPDNLQSIQRHIGHVVHALDPSMMDGGPGKGYGLIKAAQGAARHIALAAEAEGASDNVKTHAQHVQASSDNVVKWAQMAMEKAHAVLTATDAATAAALAEEIHQLTTAIVEGTDANGDGRISWGEGEGGLAQATQHMGLMKRGEGM
ncbi:MAG: hypothetical protein R3E10_13375 [Gemmatimonadota bacterium]